MLLVQTKFSVAQYFVSGLFVLLSNVYAFGQENNKTITDVDGNVYNAVTIGTQVWMVENLKTTKLNDGTSISNITEGTEWINSNTPGYCWYENDSVNKNIYGALYNWYSVNTGKLCPRGWHVPSDTEWLTLTNYLGGEDVAGNKLQETDTIRYQPTYATNSSGFTALSGGYRYVYGTFVNLGTNGMWWSSTEKLTIYAWTLTLYNKYSNVIRNGASKAFGLSVRCVRD